MIKSMTFLTLSLYTTLSLASSDSEQITIETLNSLWLTFQTAERLPTPTTAKKMTVDGLKICKDWRAQVQKNFADQIKPIPACEESNGICASRNACAAYWTTELTFKNPVTLVEKTRLFTGPKSRQSMEACLQWTRDVAKQEGALYLWSTCSYQDHIDETEPVVGETQSLLDQSLEPKNRLLKHHQLQARTPNVKFSHRLSSTTDVHFPFTLRKSRPDPSDPEFKSSLAECESWRTKSLKKFAAQSPVIDPCRQAGSSCQFSNPPTCFFSHTSRITWKIPRTIYLIERTFSSQGTPSQAFDSCRRWLKDEQDFATAETIDGKCRESGSQGSLGMTIHSITGSVTQLDLE